MIPRRLHRVWVGENMPKVYEQYWETFRRMHPRWFLKTWRENDLQWLANKTWFDATLIPAQKADIARVEILLRYGGIYVDCDVEPLRPFDPLRDCQAFTGKEDPQHINTGVMGCEVGHPLFAEYVWRIPGSIKAHPGKPPNVQTGPLLLHELVHAQEWPGLVVHDPIMFYPYHWQEEDPGIYPEESYAVHHWAKSWIDA